MKIAFAVLAIAQIVGITLKLSAAVVWSWWIVLIPFYAFLTLLALISICSIVMANHTEKELSRTGSN